MCVFWNEFKITYSKLFVRFFGLINLIFFSTFSIWITNTNEFSIKPYSQEVCNAFKIKYDAILSTRNHLKHVFWLRMLFSNSFHFSIFIYSLVIAWNFISCLKFNIVFLFKFVCVCLLVLLIKWLNFYAKAAWEKSVLTSHTVNKCFVQFLCIFITFAKRQTYFHLCKPWFCCCSRFDFVSQIILKYWFNLQCM